MQNFVCDLLTSVCCAHMVSLVLTVLHVSRICQELHDIKRKNAALQMQHFVGEEENELLEYLRSLQPEKVLMIRNSSCVKWVLITCW